MFSSGSLSALTALLMLSARLFALVSTLSGYLASVLGLAVRYSLTVELMLSVKSEREAFVYLAVFPSRSRRIPFAFS